MIRILYIPMIVFMFSCSKSSYKEPTKSNEISHDIWEGLLKKHVSTEGNVDYEGFIADSNTLNMYLAKISANAPSKNDSKDVSKAYWINAYNAYTVKLIISHYPIKSIQELHPTVKIPGVSTVWHKKFFKINNQDMSLNYIEHHILRAEYNDPRIHFAINCASKSCPILLNEAYIPEKLNSQLEQQAIAFINNSFRNKITKEQIQLSRIFQWFKGDFTKESSLVEFLNKYSDFKINGDSKLDFLDYDWSLNN